MKAQWHTPYKYQRPQILPAIYMEQTLYDCALFQKKAARRYIRISKHPHIFGEEEQTSTASHRNVNNFGTAMMRNYNRTIHCIGIWTVLLCISYALGRQTTHYICHDLEEQRNTLVDAREIVTRYRTVDTQHTDQSRHLSHNSKCK